MLFDFIENIFNALKLGTVFQIVDIVDTQLVNVALDLIGSVDVQVIHEDDNFPLEVPHI